MRCNTVHPLCQMVFTIEVISWPLPASHLEAAHLKFVVLSHLVLVDHTLDELSSLQITSAEPLINDYIFDFKKLASVSYYFVITKLLLILPPAKKLLWRRGYIVIQFFVPLWLYAVVSSN